VDVPDPLTLPLHDTAIVATAVITFAGIVRWFQAQRHLTAGNADAVGVLIARRVAGQPFHKVDAGFGPAGIYWRVPLFPGMVIFHLVPPPARSSS
jgi:hypothetical protein